jgi:dolichol-phosphate mannosyltransferase
MTLSTDDRRATLVRLAVVVPLYNESEAAPLLVNELRTVFSPAALTTHAIADVEYIFVDDGSEDDTAAKLAGEIGNGLPARLIRLSRNFGHQAAVSAGLDAADADVIAVIDADLQDPPSVLLDMLQCWRDGHDVIYGVRRKRKENVFKRFAYALFYRLIAYLTDNLIPRDSGDFSLMDRRALDALRRLPEKLRFIRGMRAWVGFRQFAYEYERTSRQAGAPKYNFKRLYRLATDGIATSSIRPLRLTQALAILFFLFSLIIAGGSAAWLLSAKQVDATFAAVLFLTAFCAVAFFSIFFSLYVLSAYVGRSYLEVKGRPPYVVMETIERRAASSAKQPGQ